MTDRIIVYSPPCPGDRWLRQRLGIDNPCVVAKVVDEWEAQMDTAREFKRRLKILNESFAAAYKNEDEPAWRALAEDVKAHYASVGIYSGTITLGRDGVQAVFCIHCKRFFGELREALCEHHLCWQDPRATVWEGPPVVVPTVTFGPMGNLEFQATTVTEIQTRPAGTRIQALMLAQDDNVYEVPKGSQVVRALGDGQYPRLVLLAPDWDAPKPKEGQRFVVLESGDCLPEERDFEAKYIDTVRLQTGLIRHVFQMVPKGPR
jgi:hypothetical protein